MVALAVPVMAIGSVLGAEKLERVRAGRAGPSAVASAGSSFFLAGFAVSGGSWVMTRTTAATTPSAAAQSYGSMGFAAPGTFALAMVFLLAFVLYYFINWKYLSTVWGLS